MSTMKRSSDDKEAITNKKTRTLEEEDSQPTARSKNESGIESCLKGPDEVLVEILNWLSTPVLVCFKSVNRRWKRCCTVSIDNKLLGTTTTKKKKYFVTNTDLRSAVAKYAKHDIADAEEFASTYGWPINKWDVSRVTDFSNIFFRQQAFNENIGSWDVSNATTTEHMFLCAKAFDRDISSWDTSKVTNMSGMFCKAKNFNRDISSWNISKANDLSSMFKDAESFNQDLSSWNLSTVQWTYLMFENASVFDMINNAPQGLNVEIS